MGSCIQLKFNSVLHFESMKKYDYKHIDFSIPSGVDDMMKQIQKLGNVTGHLHYSVSPDLV